MSGHRLALALSALSHDDTRTTRREVLVALAESELLFPAAEPEPGEPALSLAYTQDEAGRPLLPGFTDQRRLAAWAPGSPYVRAEASVFLPTILAGPFVG